MYSEFPLLVAIKSPHITHVTVRRKSDQLVGGEKTIDRLTGIPLQLSQIPRFDIENVHHTGFAVGQDDTGPDECVFNQHHATMGLVVVDAEKTIWLALSELLHPFCFVLTLSKCGYLEVCHTAGPGIEAACEDVCTPQHVTPLR
jgi:hypothetical protein